MGMDIGSAKLPEKERQGIPHYLIDVKDPSESFDVTEFVRLAEEAAAGIYARGHLPILVGGTGFYLQAFLKGLDFRRKKRKVYNRDVPGKTTLLWSNPDPSSAFAAQNVAIGDQSGSAFIRVNVRYQSTGSNASLKGVIDIPYSDGNVSNLGVLTGSYSRQATISGNNIQFADAKSGTTTGNGYIIPESIYSIKL